MKQPTISRIILSLMSLCFFCNVLFAQNMVKVRNGDRQAKFSYDWGKRVRKGNPQRRHH